ncbi:hypothetical protein SAMN05216227_101064 [Pseudorhodobacter antarcticus]|uniref:Secreted protein n=1 Tax=Pseudorhodobacter antarcticus TaxID=1077947 RepID=A0A1H8F8V2_9RHOB|nr:hypothetical protein [Pseudorhodobacter antarcticus]SEN27975.1 hypothetical protein SAMN05216227_101064 [Pseudorhodobacter antarcticus]
MGFRWLMLAVALSACQMGGGAGPDAATDIAPPNAIIGPTVEVTRLDAPPAAAAAPAPSAALVPMPKPEPIAGRKIPDQIACEKRGGSFVAFGASGLMTCQTPTRDSGKQCKRESDCDGVCLARSRTCAPVKPLLGCNAVLQNDGRRVDLCID